MDPFTDWGGLLTLTFPTHNVGRCRSQESETGALQGAGLRQCCLDASTHQDWGEFCI